MGVSVFECSRTFYTQLNDLNKKPGDRNPYIFNETLARSTRTMLTYVFTRSLDFTSTTNAGISAASVSFKCLFIIIASPKYYKQLMINRNSWQ